MDVDSSVRIIAYVVPSVQGHSSLKAKPGIHQSSSKCRVGMGISIGVVKRRFGYPRTIEKMYTKEGNNEACNEGHDIRCITGIEALEKDERCDNGGT